MSGGAKLAAFAAVLIALFAGAAGAGKAIDPDTSNREDSRPKEHPMQSTGHAHTGASERHGGHGAESAPGGLAVADRGLRLIPEATMLERGRVTRFTFRIADSNGATVRDFDVEHARRMHTIVVRRDMTSYQHVHPRQLRDGRWSVNLRLTDPGVYRLYADFAARGGSHTLATDVFIPGRFNPRPVPARADRASVDGYDVALHRHGDELDFEISRGGKAVNVEPYLGADGHLVALREGDLAFLHVHPIEGDAAAHSGIAFGTTYPSPGRYRLFLQFKHDGRVHTAEFTQESA